MFFVSEVESLLERHLEGEMFIRSCINGLRFFFQLVLTATVLVDSRFVGFSTRLGSRRGSTDEL